MLGVDGRSSMGIKEMDRESRNVSSGDITCGVCDIGKPRGVVVLLIGLWMSCSSLETFRVISSKWTYQRKSIYKHLIGSTYPLEDAVRIRLHPLAESRKENHGTGKSWETIGLMLFLWLQRCNQILGSLRKGSVGLLVLRKTDKKHLLEIDWLLYSSSCEWLR